MPHPDRNTLAIVGAGPIGLEAALAGLDEGFDVHVFEQGEVGSHPIAWGHVRLFTPWRMNVGPTSAKHLHAAGWTAPDADGLPTGAEYAEQYLQPIAELTELQNRVHTHAQVVHIGRRGALKGDWIGNSERRNHPFRILVRDQGGRENFVHAFAVIDASGVYGQPNRAGEGGIPARQELYLAPQMAYHLEDVLGARREHYAGRSVLVVGAGASAATTVRDLAELAGQAEGTRVVWVTREVRERVCAEIPNDPLPERRRLHERARGLAGGSHPAVRHVGGATIDGFDYNSATHRYGVTLRVGDATQVEEADRVIVNTGFTPDASIYRELQIHECYATCGVMKLSAALLDSGATDCVDTPAFGADVLANPEPDFYILGHKSYGRNSNFLLETGFKQVTDVVAKLGRDLVAGGEMKTRR